MPVPEENILLRQTSSANDEHALLKRELDEAHAMNRGLLRQLKKAQESAAEALRAHSKMVGTLTETMRENTVLHTDRDHWRTRAQRAEAEIVSQQQQQMVDVSPLMHGGTISQSEARAIRKAMARLHHPDSGGDPERMKAWNAILDRIEQQHHAS